MGAEASAQKLFFAFACRVVAALSGAPFCFEPALPHVMNGSGFTAI
jgi:hypothetical protein